MDITEYCLECRNFFLANGKSDIHSGVYTITDGEISNTDFLIEGQYFRIMGSKLNNGVYLNTVEGRSELKNETFSGAVWDMSVPPAFINDCEEMESWRAKYGTADSNALSPFTSESFGGEYSYSKPSGSSSDGASATSYQAVYADKLRKWRRLNNI